MDGRPLKRNDIFTRLTLAECGLLDEADQVCSVPHHVVGHVASLINELNMDKDQNEKLKSEVCTLHAQLVVSQGKLRT